MFIEYPMADRQAQDGTLERSSVFVGIVGQILVISQPSSHAIERSLCGDTVELCPDNLIGTNTPAAPDNCCPQPQGTAPS